MSAIGFCSVEGCTRKAQVVCDYRYLGCVTWCGWQPCQDHVQEEDECPKCDFDEDCDDMCEPHESLVQVNVDAVRNHKTEIEAAASLLAGGSFDATLDDHFNVPFQGVGNSNILVRIEFDNGVHWFARIKSRTSFMPFPGQVAASEVATMRCLHSVAPDLIPNAWLPPYPIGNLPLNFVELREGNPHNGSWIKGANNDPPEFASTIIRDYAAALVKLTSVSFEGIGSLTDGLVGPVALPDARLASAGKRGLGPFATMADYVVTKADILLDLLSEGAYRTLSTAPPSSHYLALLEMKTLVGGNEELCTVQRTYVKHTDDNGTHLLVKDGRLSAIIDWECAMTFPLPLAIHAYWLSYQSVYDSPCEYTDEERLLQAELVALGRQDLADAYERGLVYAILWKLLWCPAGPLDYRHLNKLRELCLGTEDGLMPTSDDEWVESALIRYADDPGLKALLEEEA